MPGSTRTQEPSEEGPPERVMVPCASCALPVETFWAPGNRGLISGSFVLVADWVYHNHCWDKQLKEHPP